jgi:adenosyl cobinamide kinase/adenosyl cobinamide phosphate guanylyltransferase
MNQNETARIIIQGLLDGHPPDGDVGETCGAWAEVAQALVDAHASGGPAGVRQMFDTLSRMHPDLAKLIASHTPTPATNEHQNGTHDAAQPRFRLISADDLMQLPPPTFLVKDTIVLGETTVIAGPGDSGKTFLVTDMCWKVAQHYPVCYIAAEDAHGISLRMQAWCNHHQHPRPQNFHVLGTGAGVPCAVELMDAPQVDDLILTLQMAQIKLVVVDTLSQCSGGAEENGNDMTRLTAACNRIAHTTGAAVVVIHHTTKDGKHYRGHSSLKDNTYGFFDVAKEDDVINLAKVRIKNTGAIPERRFRLVTIDLGKVDTYGEPITSAVALPAHKVKTTSDDLTPSRREVLSQIALMQDAGAKATTTHIKSGLKHIPDRTFYRALKWLRECGLIEPGLLENSYYLTPDGRNKLEQAGDDPDRAADLLPNEEYFQVNTGLSDPDPDPTPPGGASYTPPVAPVDTATQSEMVIRDGEGENANTATPCHPTDMAALAADDPDCHDLPHASKRQWQAVAGQQAEPETGQEEKPGITQAKERLEQAAALLKAGEPDTIAQSLLNGLSGWLKQIVRSSIDRMIHARHSGNMSIDEALRVSLARLEAGGTP